MTDANLTPALLDLLRKVDTPTVSNAIEVAEGGRGFANFTHQMTFCSDPEAPAVVGLARTAKIAGASAPMEAADVLQARRLDYYRHMAFGPGPNVAVIEDLDGPDCIAAWWGEVNTTVHKGLGLAGAVTNGVMRDLGDMPAGFPVIAGSTGPSHAHVHLREVGGGAEVFGMKVNDGDLVHADRHGALVVPRAVLGDLAAGIDKMQAIEALVLKPAAEPGFTVEKLQAAWAEMAKLRG